MLNAPQFQVWELNIWQFIVIVEIKYSLNLNEYYLPIFILSNKGNNKITEQSSKGKVKTHKIINRQNQSKTGNCENRNDPDLVQAFLKKWWVKSDFKAPNLPLLLRLKGSGCHYNSICNNTGTK